MKRTIGVIGWMSRPLMVAWVIAASGCGTADPASARATFLQRGDSLMERQRYQDAVDVYRRAVQIDPMNAEAHLKLADALWRGQNWNAGALEAVRAADLMPANQTLQVLAASRELTLHRFSEAASRASIVLRDRPDNVEALVVLGNATAKLSDSFSALLLLRGSVLHNSVEAAVREIRPTTLAIEDAKAEQIFRKALGLAPHAYETRLALVNFLWAAWRPQEAEKMLRELADEQPGNLLLNQALGDYYVSRDHSADGEHYLAIAATLGARDTALALADRYIASGRDGEALALLDRLKDDDPPGSVSLRRAAVECRGGQRARALEAIDQLLARFPRHGRALEVKAECLLPASPREALDVARAAVAEEGTSAQAHFLLGQALSASGASDEAFAEFTEALRLDPLHKPVLRALVREALDVGRADVAVTAARQLVRAAPDDEAAGSLLVTALIRQRDFFGAAATLRPLLARFPSSADLLVREGDLNGARHAEGARVSYERALKLNPDSFDALAGLVSLDLQEGQRAVARQRVERVFSSHRDDQRYVVLLAQVLGATGDVAGSEKMYRRVLAAAPANTSASLELSTLLAHAGRTDEARLVLEQLLAQRPKAREARVALALLLENAGRIADAAAQYRAALADNSRDGVAAYKLASLQADQGENLDVARDLAVMAMQELPKDPGASDALGWIYVRKNLADVGVPLLRSSVGAAPDNPTYRYHLGMAYLSLGARERARVELTKALELNPGFRFAPEARAALGAGLGAVR